MIIMCEEDETRVSCRMIYCECLLKMTKTIKKILRKPGLMKYVKNFCQVLTTRTVVIKMSLDLCGKCYFQPFIGIWWFTSLSTIFQLDSDGQFLLVEETHTLL
jgi:hypothetical protein